MASGERGRASSNPAAARLRARTLLRRRSREGEKVGVARLSEGARQVDAPVPGGPPAAGFLRAVEPGRLFVRMSFRPGRDDPGLLERADGAGRRRFRPGGDRLSREAEDEERGEDHREAKTTRSRKRLSLLAPLDGDGRRLRRPAEEAEDPVGEGADAPLEGGALRVAPGALLGADGVEVEAAPADEAGFRRRGRDAREVALARGEPEPVAPPRPGQARQRRADVESRRRRGRRTRAARQRRLREVDELGLLRRRDLQEEPPGAIGSGFPAPPLD